MTNYLGSAGAQQFSITIASGSTTGTATISAVGSGAFIIYGGVNPSVTSDYAEGYAYLTLTNSTTITATRNTGTAGTVVVNGCIIDGDTTNLIKSVQQGTISISSSGTSGTATISAVTNANAAVHFMGSTTSDISGIVSENKIRLSLSGTTVTANVVTSGVSHTVGYEIIEFQGTALTANAVQNVSASSSSSVSSFTASITSVNTSNAISIFGGWTVSGTGPTPPSFQYLRGSLTNNTTFTVNVNTASTPTRTFNASIVEFNSGVLNSAVQRGTTALSSATSNTSTITSVVVGNSGINYLGNTSTDGAGASLNIIEGKVALTNGTTVTTTLNSSASITSSWEVFEFSTGGGVTILPINNLGGWFGI